MPCEDLIRNSKSKRREDRGVLQMNNDSLDKADGTSNEVGKMDVRTLSESDWLDLRAEEGCQELTPCFYLDSLGKW